MEKLGLLGLIGLNGGGDGPTPEPIPPIPEDEWIRPSYWPDLSGIHFSEDEDISEMYFIHDKTSNPGAKTSFYINCYELFDWTLEQGDIIDNEFVPYTSVSWKGSNKEINKSDIERDVTVCRLWHPKKSSYDYSYLMPTKFSLSTDSVQSSYYGCIKELYVSLRDTYVQTANTGIQHIVIKNTPNIENLGTYNACLQKVDFENAPFEENLKLSKAFNECCNLTEIDLSKFEGRTIINLNAMFFNCNRLKEIKGLNKLDTSRISDMSYLFYACYSLKSVDISTWDTSHVTSFQHMFSNCNHLVSLDLSHFDTSANTERLSYMFFNDTALTSVDMSSFNNLTITIPERVVNMKFPRLAVTNINSMNSNGEFKRYTISRNSLMDFISKAEDNSSAESAQGIQLYARPFNYGTLSVEDVAQFTNKGYTVILY